MPTGAAGPAFTSKLALSAGLGPMPSAHDFAAAWKAAMSAVMAFDALDTREGTLRTTLSNLFDAPSINATDRLLAIAVAFHTVTAGITSGGTIVYG